MAHSRGSKKATVRHERATAARLEQGLLADPVTCQACIQEGGCVATAVWLVSDFCQFESESLFEELKEQ